MIYYNKKFDKDGLESSKEKGGYTMKKKYTWIRQITRVLMTLMLTIAVSVPVMAEPKAVDVDTQLSICTL